MAASTVSLNSLQTLSPPRASTVSHKAAQSPKPALAIQTNRRKLLFFSLTAMPVLTAMESACFAEDIGLFGLRKKVRQAEKEAVKLVKEAEREIKTAEKEIETAEIEIETGVVGFGGLAQAGAVAGAEVVGLELDDELQDSVTHSLSSCCVEKVVIDNENEKDLVSNGTNQSTSPSPDSGFIQFPNREFNKRVALFSTLGAVGFFIFTRLDLGVSLKDLSAAALPYEEALGNGKPTVVEFYADWNRVNFVMLNVDNTRWEQELDEFGVEGIPHFAFLDREGNEEGNVVGRLPRKYLLENVDALARGEASVPHARVVGQYTSAENRKVHQIVDPRSHG
ncbi:hypothetical protein EZV62_014115 [Acer yangbiense]|uniref:Thioredoxin domain-containing protein n=1 Tax=Acer yangbiense TaxID=1000413 RepID=A0A5C7HTL1_9ROSI|nr:hypothetical protein EZV62_014115 [Acer yangbiense]